MSKPLHILNGDSTLWAMESIDMPGKKLVWRDVLSEGPALADFASPEFWSVRTQFMVEAYGTTPEGFKTKCIDEFRQLEQLDGIDEVVLWFEYDLFCQVNMIGILHFLAQNTPELSISLICVGKMEGHDGLVALGEIPPETFPELFEQRTSLDQDNLTYASRVFQSYCNKDPRAIHQTLEDHPSFPYLKGAFDAHLKRFPFKSSGLTEIETALLDTIRAGATTPRETVGKILRWQKGTYYGFGDSQYFNHLKKLMPLMNDDFSIKHEVAFDQIDRNYMLGGANVRDWLWDDENEELIPS